MAKQTWPLAPWPACPGPLIYGWFAESFEAHDLTEATGLLDELRWTSRTTISRCASARYLIRPSASSLSTMRWAATSGSSLSVWTTTSGSSGTSYGSSMPVKWVSRPARALA